MTAGRWITVVEAAELLSAHPQTLYGWVSSGKLAAARIGRRFIRIDRVALERELERMAAGEPVPGKQRRAK